MLASRLAVRSAVSSSASSPTAIEINPISFSLFAGQRIA